MHDVARKVGSAPVVPDLTAPRLAGVGVAVVHNYASGFEPEEIIWMPKPTPCKKS